jgi:hypothetical protein
MQRKTIPMIFASKINNARFKNKGKNAKSVPIVGLIYKSLPSV